jgi:hypothetical protein
MAEYKVEVDLGRIGRTNEHDKWALIDNNDLNLWVSAESLIQEVKYSHKGVEVRVKANLSKIIYWYRTHQESNKKFNEALECGEKEVWKLIPNNDDNLILPVEISITGENDISSYGWYPRFFVEKYIYDIFFVMNMSVPGSCEFLNLRIRETDGSDRERLYLSAYNFEEAYYDYLDNKKLAPIELPIEVVFNWYKKLGMGTKQKAETDVEKAIFSLLHICKSDMDVSSIIWIFHALEAIYGTRVGEGFTNLIGRMTVFLELEERSQKIVKKHLRELYNYRSSFVHGGYKVHHPMRNEIIDKRLNDDYSRTYELGQFGFNLIVASIQQLIRKDWFGIEVSEEIKGIACPNKQLNQDAPNSDTPVS